MVLILWYASNDYLEEYRDLTVFYKRYVGEEMLDHFISYTDMKKKYPIQVIDHRFQVDSYWSKENSIALRN